MGRFPGDNVHFTFKNIIREPFALNKAWMIDKRYDYVSLINRSDIDYYSNCIFIDEAGFQIDMSPLYDWAPSGVTPVSRVSGKSENRTVMGAVNSKGVIQLNLKKPFRNVAKKRKTASARRGQANEDRDETVGTTARQLKYFVLLLTLDIYPEYRNCYQVFSTFPRLRA